MKRRRRVSRSVVRIQVVRSVRSLRLCRDKSQHQNKKNDLLSFWEIRRDRFENKVKYFILHNLSTNVPQRQAKLLAFSSSKVIKKKIKLIEKEKKPVNKCLRRSLA